MAQNQSSKHLVNLTLNDPKKPNNKSRKFLESSINLESYRKSKRYAQHKNSETLKLKFDKTSVKSSTQTTQNVVDSVKNSIAL